MINAPVSMDFRHSIAGNNRFVVDNEYTIRRLEVGSVDETSLTLEPNTALRLIGADIVQRVTIFNLDAREASIIGFNAAKTDYLRRLEKHVIMRLMQSLQHGATLRIGEMRLETCAR